jgi:hypothetical protein
MKPPSHVDAGHIAAEAEPVGAHLHVRIRGGVPGQRAVLGTLVASPEDWSALAGVLKRGRDGGSDVGSLFSPSGWAELVANTRYSAHALVDAEDPFYLGALACAVQRATGGTYAGWGRVQRARVVEIAIEAARRAEELDEREGVRFGAFAALEPADVDAADVPH